eukprot:7071794-Karenia_brevis.AAC.1
MPSQVRTFLQPLAVAQKIIQDRPGRKAQVMKDDIVEAFAVLGGALPGCASYLTELQPRTEGAAEDSILAS